MTRTTKSLRAWATFSLWVFLALLYLLPPLGHLRDDAWDYDEGPLLQAAALSHAGARLYSEVSLNKPPMLIWVVRCGFSLFGLSLVAARLAVLTVTFAGFLSFGALGNALFGPPAGLCTLALLLCIEDFVPRGCVVMPDLPAISFAVVAILCARRYALAGRARWASLSALMYAMAVATHPLIAGVALPLAVLLVSPAGSTHRSRLTVLSVYALGVLSLNALMVLPYDRAGMLRWVLRYNLAPSELTEPSWVLISRYLRGQWVFVLLALGSCGVLWRERGLRTGVLVGLSWFAATVLTFALWRPLWDNYYLWMLCPLALLSGALPARWITGLRPSRSPLGKLWPCALCLGVLCVLGARGLARRVWRGRSWETHAVVTDLVRVSSPGEYIASDDPFVVFVAGRRAPPPLADTSHKSISTGFLRSPDALWALRTYRVRVVLLGTGRIERMEAFTRAVRLATIDRRVTGEHERLVIDLARIR